MSSEESSSSSTQKIHITLLSAHRTHMEVCANCEDKSESGMEISKCTGTHTASGSSNQGMIMKALMKANLVQLRKANVEFVAFSMPHY
jgi:hypothetical protein